MSTPVKNLALVLGMAAWSAMAGLAAAEGEPIVLENRALRLEIGRSPVPFVGRLVHKGSGRAVVADPASKSLVAVVLAKKAGGLETIESASAGESSVAVEKIDGGRKVAIRYGKFPAGDLGVEVTAVCTEKDPLTRWSIRIDSPAGRRIVAVRFPQVLAVPAIGDGADDVLVLPALPGALIENPGQAWRIGQRVTLRYPGSLSAQFLTYQDHAAGVYLAGMDAAGWPMSLAVAKAREGYLLRHEFTPAADAQNAAGSTASAGTRWQSPYPVALGVTQGTWCDSADQYKRWALRQPWCAKTLVERDDIPAWWKKGPDVHVVEVRTYDRARKCNGSYYPRLLEHVRTLRGKIDGPVVVMLAGWENHRRWTAGDYFPVFDRPNAVKVIDQLKRDGSRPFFFLSGLYYTYENEGRDGSKIPAADRYASAYVIDERTGKPRKFVLNESNPAGVWKRHSHAFCVGSPSAAEFFCGVVDRAQALGVDVLQMDQTVQGAGLACYSTAHGHAPGAGRYQSVGFWRLLDRLRRRGKGKSPDFVLFHEEPHEQLIPHVDGFHVREYYEKRWYRGTPGAVGIPLFSYLYHEYAIGYGGDSAGLSSHDSRWLIRAHAMNLVTGRTPGGAIWSSHRSMFDAHPDQVSLIRSHCRLLKTRARDFLMLGRMLHPYELDVPKLAIRAPGRSGKAGEVATPAVLTSSWRSPAGAIGHLFVNISKATQPIKVALDARNAPAPKVCDAAIYRSTAGGSFKPLRRSAPPGQQLDAELAPLEVVFVELRAAGGP